MVALLEELFHLTAEIFLVVFEFLVIKADVRIARHGKNTAFLDCVSIE